VTTAPISIIAPCPIVTPEVVEAVGIQRRKPAGTILKIMRA
jgi:hypothetical protein